MNAHEFTDGQVERSIQGALNGNHYKGNVRYNSACSCCYLGFSHTVEYHNRSIGRASSPLTCPRCATPTVQFGLCAECQKSKVQP